MIKKNGNNNNRNSNNDNDKTTTYDYFKYKYDYQSKHKKTYSLYFVFNAMICIVYIHGSSIFVFILNIQGFTIHNKKFEHTLKLTYTHTHTLSDISTRSNFEYIICSRLPSIII